MILSLRVMELRESSALRLLWTTELNTRVIGTNLIAKMERVPKFGLMDHYTRATGKTIRPTEEDD